MRRLAERVAVGTRRADRLALVLVALVLTVVYAPALQATYYMRDEFYLVQDAGPPLVALPVYWIASGWHSGRPIAYSVYATYFALNMHGGLFWIRLSQVVMTIGAAAFFFHLLRRRAVGPAMAAAIVVFLWSQPALAVSSAYSNNAPYWFGVCGGWFAFLLIYDAPGAAPERRRWLAAGMLLFAGYLTFQAAPYGALAPAAFYALTASPAEWSRVRRRCVGFVALLGGVTLVYVVFTKLMLAVTGVQLTSPVRRAFALLSGTDAAEYARLLDVSTLLGPFEWWNYVVAVPPLSPTTYLALSGASALAWFLSCGLAFAAERAQRADAAARWGFALLAVGLTYVPVALEGLTGLHRQHTFIAAVPALVLVLLHAAGVVRRAVPVLDRGGGPLAAVGTVAVVLVAAGARAGLERGVIEPHARAHAFVLDAMEAWRGKAVESIVVVNDGEAPCPAEPCRGFYGQTPWSETRQGFAGYFRRLARDTLGVAQVPVTFTSISEQSGEGPIHSSPTTLVVDYRLFTPWPLDPG